MTASTSMPVARRPARLPHGGRSQQDSQAPESLSIVTWEPLDLSKALVVVGFPGLGLVGGIAAGYLVDSLPLKEVAYIISPAFPPTAIVDNGISASPVRVFLGDVVCGPDGSCEQLCVILSFVAPPPRVTTALAHSLVLWAKAHSARQMVWFEGVKAEGLPVGEPRVTGVASDEAGRKMLEMLNIPRSPDGVLVGVGAVATSVARIQSQPALCFFAETREDFPDARAAARLLETLQPIIPLVRIDEKPLVEHAEALEADYRARSERSKATVKDLSRSADVMFG